MATIDASIPLGVRQPQIEPPINQLAKLMQIQGFQQQNELGRMQIEDHRRSIEDQNALRAALSAPDADPYKVLLQRGKVKEAVDFQKGTTEAAKHKVDLVDAKLKQSRQFLDTVKTPEEYIAWHQANHADPILGAELAARGVTPEKAMATIQQALQTPGGFEELLQRSALGLEKFTADLRQRQQLQETNRHNTATESLKAANEPFTVGQDGQPVPNQPVQRFQMGKARAGATNVSVNTEKGYAGQMAEGLAKQDLAALDAARGAPERIANAQRVKQILDTQPTITGTGAEGRLAFQKALSTAGLIDGQAVKSTEDLASLLASSTLDAIKTSGLGSGQGFTDKDRQFLERAKSGNIEINSGTLRTLADLNERAARNSIEAGSKVAGRLKGHPSFGSVGQDLSFNQPPEYKPQKPSVVRKPAASAPAGVRFLGFEEK